jgi:hypothetical protein
MTDDELNKFYQDANFDQYFGDTKQNISSLSSVQSAENIKAQLDEYDRTLELQETSLEAL